MWVITFDLFSKSADRIKAYTKIMMHLAKHNFYPMQKSVYASSRGVDNLHNAINELKTIKGLNLCVNDFKVLQMFDPGSDFTTIMKTP